MPQRGKKIFRPTSDERCAYRGLYPLYGFISISKRRCAIEDLRGCGASDDPQKDKKPGKRIDYLWENHGWAPAKPFNENAKEGQ